MLKSVNYNSLAAIGLTLWQPRPLSHPALAQQNNQIVPEPLRINAKCAVLLFAPVDSAAEQKILHGMLGVLDLPAAQLMLVKIYSQNPNLTLLASTLQQWMPFSVLQLNMDLPAITLNAHIARTFSPAHLLQNAQHKAQAYKDLLTLRKILHHDGT